MLKVKTIHFAVPLTTKPQQILPEELSLVARTLQNQDALAIIYVRWGGDGIQQSYLRLDPGWNDTQDVMPSTEEMWAYSNVDGTLLTVVSRVKVPG